jgi:hypothetical protein
MDFLLYLFYGLFKAIAFQLLCFLGVALEWLTEGWRLPNTTSDNSTQDQWSEYSFVLPGAYLDTKPDQRKPDHKVSPSLKRKRLPPKPPTRPDLSHMPVHVYPAYVRVA